jgi:short-subunit dehydrogenase
VRRFGRQGFRGTLVSRGEKLQPVAAALRQEGIEVDTLVADASDLDNYRSTLESLYAAPGGAGGTRLQRLDLGSRQHPYLIG